MLGVIVGVMSVVLVVGIGEGIRHQVGAQTEHLGKDLITIRPGQLPGRPSPGVFGTSNVLAGLNMSTGGTLSSKDLDTVTKTPGVAGAVPLSVVGDGVISPERSHKYDMLVMGTNPGLPAILHQGLAYGAFFLGDTASSDKIVLGAHAAELLYDEHVPLGQGLTILGHQFIVVGVLNDFQTAPLSVDADFNNVVFLPYATAQAITNGNSPTYEILARPVAVDQTETVVGRLRDNLVTAHGGQHDFTVLKQGQTLAVTDEILHLLTVLISGVAAISLLVGGVGIMNVMLVSITERMQEVGIRKALGATDRQILMQFVTEATVLSLTGGLIGIALSFVVAAAIALATSLTPVITWQVVVITCAVSVGIGVIFGSVPALKAARKDPIAALRNE